MQSWYQRLFLREDGYFGRGGFTECMITSSSALYGLALLWSGYAYLPTAVDSLIWKGIPVSALALPAMIFSCMSFIGIFTMSSLVVSRDLRFTGMLGQFGCAFAALALGLYESGGHVSTTLALQLPYAVAAVRTSILIRFRAWPA